MSLALAMLPLLIHLKGLISAILKLYLSISKQIFYDLFKRASPGKNIIFLCQTYV